MTYTFTAGGEAGAQLRQLAQVIEKAAMVLGDRNPTGASVTCVLDNAPSSGFASVTIAGGGLPTQPTFLA